MKRCRTCGLPVEWATTRDGTRVLLDMRRRVFALDPREEGERICVLDREARAEHVCEARKR